MPCSCAFLETSSAATCAAYGVDLREPLKPIVPADDQAMALPCASVMVMVVLLNDEFTCAMPLAMFLRSRRRTRVASLPIDYLSCDLKRRRNASGYTPAEPRTSPPQNSKRSLTSSCRRSPWPDPCACAHWCGYADRAPADRGDGAGRDSSRGPSDA